MKSLQLPRPLVNRLLGQAQQNIPNEICGLIGKNTQQLTAYPVDNIAEPSTQIFEMDPQQQIAAIKTMRENNDDFFAIYHSHPSAPATPSKIDQEQMHYSDVYYLIISLNTVGVLEMKAYWVTQNNFTGVELEII